MWGPAQTHNGPSKYREIRVNLRLFLLWQLYQCDTGIMRGWLHNIYIVAIVPPHNVTDDASWLLSTDLCSPGAPGNQQLAWRQTMVQSWSRERETSQVTTVDSVVWTIIAGGWGQYITVVGKWSRNDPGKLLWVLWLWFGNKVITGEMRQELCDKHDRVVMNLKPINHIQTLLWFPVLQIVNFLPGLPTVRLI